jgi:DNA topoisomerase-6 subunit B
MSKRGQAEMAKKRANLYAKYIPLIAEFCTELAGKKKAPNFQKILDVEKASQPKLVSEENEIENK